MQNTSNTQKRAGGEKRGNAYDRHMRLVRLTARDGEGSGVPVLVRKRKRSTSIERQNGAGTWKVVTEAEIMRLDCYCAHCDGVLDLGVRRVDGFLTLVGEERKADDPYCAQQDRIDPDGGYTLDNLQLLCGPCNKLKGDHYIG
jgi:5-methylcytosine-specific restriction endonuclease McrA